MRGDVGKRRSDCRGGKKSCGKDAATHGYVTQASCSPPSECRVVIGAGRLGQPSQGAMPMLGLCWACTKACAALHCAALGRSR
jgi:hypothetical protein